MVEVCKVQPEKVRETLTPSTIRVYLHILKRNPKSLSLTDLKDELGLTKPTILHHLSRLQQMNLIEQNTDGYKINPEKVPSIGVLKVYLKVGPYLVSRYLIYSLLFLGVFALIFLMKVPFMSTHGFISYIIDIAAFGFSFREYLRWKEELAS